MRYIIAILSILFFSVVSADGHLQSEKEVLTSLDKYFDARNNNDYETVVALESKTGTYGTNSDGSFHKPKNTQTAQDWEDQNVDGTGVINVHSPEAYQLNDAAVYVRYYAEGVVPDGNGGIKPYRTRVTGVWVSEKGNWVAKTMHFSSASYGGTHQTVASDFED